MELHLLRHAIAVERGTPGFADDSLRPLTTEGRAKMERIARGMAVLGLKFDLILSSPYVRARQTAEIAAAALRLKRRLKLEPSLAADRDPAALLARLRKADWREKSLLLVGHEPFLGELAARLIGSDAGTLPFRKGGLCKLTIRRFTPRPLAQLDWFLTPRQLRLLAPAKEA